MTEIKATLIIAAATAYAIIIIGATYAIRRTNQHRFHTTCTN